MKFSHVLTFLVIATYESYDRKVLNDKALRDCKVDFVSKDEYVLLWPKELIVIDTFQHVFVSLANPDIDLNLIDLIDLRSKFCTLVFERN